MDYIPYLTLEAYKLHFLFLIVLLPHGFLFSSYHGLFSFSPNGGAFLFNYTLLFCIIPLMARDIVLCH